MLRLWRAAVLHLLLSIDDYLRVLMLSLLLHIFIYVVSTVVAGALSLRLLNGVEAATALLKENPGGRDEDKVPEGFEAT